MISRAWRLVPTNRMLPLLADNLRTKAMASLYLASVFLEVDDMNLAASTEDERCHFRVPEAGLMAEMDTGFQHLTHGLWTYSSFISGLNHHSPNYAPGCRGS